MKTSYPATRAARLLTFTAATLLGSTGYAQETSLPVIPGAKGFGIMTKAGRGGEILRVTNLSDSGAGSLRAALEAEGPRTVIFERSGTIELLSKIMITDGRLTVAGQTAPGLGILVKGRGIVIGCKALSSGFFRCANDVLFQHIAIRPGDTPNLDDTVEPRNRDALTIEAYYGSTISRIVVDHVSLSWSVDEVFTTWADPYLGSRSHVMDCTISNSIFSEALKDSIHPGGSHSMGVMIGRDSSRISLHRNLLAHLEDRNPLLNDNASIVQVANNYIHRPGQYDSNRMKLEVGGPSAGVSMVASFKANVMVPSPVTPSNTGYMKVMDRQPHPGPELTLYMNSNRIWNIASASWWPDPITSQTHSTVFNATKFTGLLVDQSSEPSVFTQANVNVPIIAWDALKTHVLANAGSRPFNRDPVDARIINQVTNNTGGLINSPGDVEGYPNIPEETVTHNPPSEIADTDGDGYSDLEEWLHGKAREVELGVPPPPTNLTPTVAAAPDNIGQINMWWTNVANEDGYKIERKRGADGIYEQIATTGDEVNSYSDTSAGTGTQYYYRVRAYNANGDSGYSTDASATTAEIAGRQAHWKLDGAGLTAADSSGYGNTGTLQFGPTWGPGRTGTALSFDGSPSGGDDIVNAGNGTSVRNLGAMTVAAWIKVQGVGEAGAGRIVHKATGTAPEYGWQFVTQGTNQLGFAVDYTTTDLVRVSAANVYNTGGWHHVVVTWDGTATASNVVMYVNGTAVGSYSTTTDAAGARVSDANANIYLGNEPNLDRTLRGALDDVRVYNRVLSPDEIRAIHDAGS